MNFKITSRGYTPLNKAKVFTSCNGTKSGPGSNSSKAEVLADSELHVEQRNSVDCKHYKVRYQEGGCQRKIIRKELIRKSIECYSKRILGVKENFLGGGVGFSSVHTELRT